MQITFYLPFICTKLMLPLHSFSAAFAFGTCSDTFFVTESGKRTRLLYPLSARAIFFQFIWDVLIFVAAIQFLLFAVSNCFVTGTCRLS